MREIEFRAWDKDQNQYIAGFDVRVDGNGNVYRRTWGESQWDRTQGLEIEQYTGLKDKNGKEIHEGDILNCWDWGREPNKLLTVSTVYWAEASWCLDPDPTDGDRYDLFRNIEIIGNVHQNPELLKQTAASND